MDGPKTPVLVGGERLVVIAGPCTLESLEMGLHVARAMKEVGERAGVDVVFKASVDKANRTSGTGRRGPGLDVGLAWLAEIRETVGISTTTDVHLPDQAAVMAEHVDLLQIPAFLCRQTDLLQAAVATGKPVNVKKGQFLSAAECAGIVAKAGGPGAILLTERGTTFGYHDLVADLRNLPRMRAHGVPVVFDATHSVQRPGLGGDHSGGERDLAPVLARAAVAAGCDAVFLEVHPDPPNAWSDAATQLDLATAGRLIGQLAELHAVVRGFAP